MDPKTPHFNTAPSIPKTKIDQALALEREAYRLRGELKIDQAFQAFDQAAKLYQEAKDPMKAAVCYSSAAACWNIHTGWQPLRNAATRSELAALQAVEAGDHAYAETLFSEAALLYEKEGDFAKFSYCYRRAQDARLSRFWSTLMQGRSPKGASAIGLEPVPLRERLVTWMRWILGSMNRLVWGYGELPFQTLAIAAGVIVVSAFCYYVSGTVLTGGFVQKIGLAESFYMSIMTYTTTSYGDYMPMGWTRFVAALEVCSGIFLTPLFLIGLSRFYLRGR